MAYETFILCEREGCNSRIQVPGPGALPMGWLSIQYVKFTLNKNDLTPQGQQVATMFVCGWQCLNKVVKQHVRDKDEQ